MLLSFQQAITAVHPPGAMSRRHTNSPCESSKREKSTNCETTNDPNITIPMRPIGHAAAAQNAVLATRSATRLTSMWLQYARPRQHAKQWRKQRDR